MQFKVLGLIRDVETIAYTSSIRELPRLRKIYGPGRWRKRKGLARIQLENGTVLFAEIHWYEATGVGRV